MHSVPISFMHNNNNNNNNGYVKVLQLNHKKPNAAGSKLKWEWSGRGGV